MNEVDWQKSLRRLQFPAGLERSYQQEYYASYRVPLRFCFALLMAAFSVMFVFVCFGPGRKTPEAIIGTGAPCALFLTLFVLSFGKNFGRYWQAGVIAGLAVLLPLMLNAMAHDVTTMSMAPNLDSKLNSLQSVCMVVLVVVLGGLRLQARWSLLAHLILYFSWAWSAGRWFNVTTVRPFYHVTLFVPQLVLFANSIVQDRLGRAAFLANYLLDIEKAKSERLLLNTLPVSVAARLKDNTNVIADDIAEATVLFADIVDFSPWSAGKPARTVLDFLNEVFSRFDRLVEEFGVEKIKTVGDSYMCISGAPEERRDHVTVIAKLALAMQDEAGALSDHFSFPVRFRIGIHTGPLAAGVIGEKRFTYDVWGDTVNTASRLESYGVPGRVQVSNAVVRGLEGSDFHIGEGRVIDMKGIGEMTAFLLSYPASLPIEAART